MISSSDRYLLTLLKSVLNNQPPLPPTQDIDWEELLQTARDHGVQAMLLPALEMLSQIISIPAEVRKAAATDNAQARISEAFQFRDGTEVLDALEAAGIDHCPLKGWNIRRLYPAPYFRFMSDFDLMVHSEDLPRVKKVLEPLGFLYCYHASLHDVYGRPPSFCLEVHDGLVKSTDSRCSYYNHIWQKLLKQSEKKHCFHMSVEDEYIFFVLHADKHMRKAGIGIRFIMDFYVYNHRVGFMDRDYIRHELSALHLSGFEEKLSILSEYWFGRDANREMIPEYLESFIFSSNLMGTKEQQVVQNFGRQNKLGSNNKLLMLLNRAFPSLDWMRIHYPNLRKCPLLLPWYWLIRANKYFKTLLGKDLFKNEVQFIFNSNEELLNQQTQILQYLYDDKKM